MEGVPGDIEDKVIKISFDRTMPDPKEGADGEGVREGKPSLTR